MLPVHFGDRDRLLFGLYEAAAAPRRRRGVVLCNPVGWEHLRAHRTLRLLAARLVAAGFDVLRFDYAGTGDSWGDLASVPGVAPWVRDVELAVEELIGMAGVERVALVGLRDGASLAIAAAESLGAAVDQLVLWDPPAGGAARRGAEESLIEPAGTLRDELDALARRAPRAPATVVVALSEERPLPASLAEHAAGRLVVPGTPVCWVEERDFGAGAVPSALLDRVVERLAG